MIKKVLYTVFDILELGLLIVLSLMPMMSKSWEAMILLTLFVWVAPVFLILKKITGQFFPGIKIDRYLVPKVLMTFYFVITFNLIGIFGFFFPLEFDLLVNWNGFFIIFMTISSRVICWILIMSVWYPPLFAKMGKPIWLLYILPIILLILLVVLPMYFGSGNQIY